MAPPRKPSDDRKPPAKKSPPASKHSILPHMAGQLASGPSPSTGLASSMSTLDCNHSSTVPPAPVLLGLEDNNIAPVAIHPYHSIVASMPDLLVPSPGSISSSASVSTLRGTASAQSQANSSFVSCSLGIWHQANQDYYARHYSQEGLSKGQSTEVLCYQSSWNFNHRLPSPDP